MKIEKINENKIKVTISIDDLLERNIDLDTLNYNTPAAQECSGHDGTGGNPVRFWCFRFPDMCWGYPWSWRRFVIIITKLDEDGEFESIHKYIKNRFRKSDLRVRKRNSRVSSSIVIYFFNNFEDLCSVCQKLRDIYSGESTLYRLKEFITWFLPKIHGQWQI